MSSPRSRYVPQHEIHEPDGRLVGRADLWIVGTRRIHEYDGAGHRTAKVHRNDLARDRALLRVRCERYGYTAPQLMGGGREIITEIDQLLGRAYDPCRLRAWNALAADSIRSPAGRARVRDRWARAE